MEALLGSKYLSSLKELIKDATGAYTTLKCCGIYPKHKGCTSDWWAWEKIINSCFLVRARMRATLCSSSRWNGGMLRRTLSKLSKTGMTPERSGKVQLDPTQDQQGSSQLRLCDVEAGSTIGGSTGRSTRSIF
jgi:hypothetical protein